MMSKSASGPLFGSGKRGALSETNKNPGPGMYDTRGRLSGPNWGFGSGKRQDLKKNESPGPGAYINYSSIANLPNYALSSSQSVNRF